MNALTDFLRGRGIQDAPRQKLVRDKLRTAFPDRKPGGGGRWLLTPDMEASVDRLLREKGWSATAATRKRLKLPAGYRCG